MVISDRVAVLYRGGVERSGRPRICFGGRARGSSPSSSAGRIWWTPACRDATMTSPVVVSIRPHEIELLTAERAAPPGANVLAGTVQRTSYLGDAVDYQVSVTGTDIVLRVTAPPPARVGPGDSVTLAVAPEACVPLTGGAAGEEPGSAG